MATGVGGVVGVAERIVAQLLESDVPLERSALERAAVALLRDHAPLAGPEVVGEVVDLLVGLGPLEALLHDDSISDVLVNGDGSVWVERRGILTPTEVGPIGPQTVVAAVERMIAPLGLRLDRSRPAVDARLPDGSRLHAMVPPAAVDGPVLAIRRFTKAASTLDELVTMAAIDGEAAELLRTAVHDRRCVLVAGGTGAGKTTLLNVLAAEIPPGERVVTIEDAAELCFDGHVVRLEARPPNAEGAGAITIAELIRHALRLRPDRIVVGEVRGGEAFDMLQAISTGHEGSMSTVHATSPAEAIWRVETMASLAAPGLDSRAISAQLRSAVDFVVQLRRSSAGKRYVAQIAEVGPTGEVTLWSC